MGGGILENCLAVEQLARACIGVATTFAASGLGAYPILLFGNEDQKQRYLPDIASRQTAGRLRPDRIRSRAAMSPASRPPPYATGTTIF